MFHGAHYIHRYITVLALGALLSACGGGGGGDDDGCGQPDGLSCDAAWVMNLDDATAIAQAPDGRLFVAEQGGTLRIVKDGELLDEPFASIDVDSENERGLLGVTLAPDFDDNGYVYVYATQVDGDGESHNRVLRYTADGDTAVDGSAELLVELPELSGTHHNGGAIHFGSDGKLYVAVGDNGGGDIAQNRNSVFGKLLRFNADGSIPTDNPFYDDNDGLGRAVWAYGLRNPYTFAVHPESGRIHINDVGERAWEEVNLGLAGANYGWPFSEGTDNLASDITAPLLAYPRGDADVAGMAISGGAFWRGEYYFADFIVTRIYVMEEDGDDARQFAQLGHNPVDMVVGRDDALYVLTRQSIARIWAP